MRIMYIDDDVEDLELFAEAVKEISNAIEFISVSSPVDAFELLHQSSTEPHFIFVDMNMPLMNGKEFLTELKRHPKYSNIPVIVCTTSSNPKDKEDCLKLGAKIFFTKFTSHQELVKTLKTIMDLSK